MHTITRENFKNMLLSACARIKNAQAELTDIDSRFGDADHGITMTKIANAIEKAIKNCDDGGLRALLDAASDAVLQVNGGSAGPLWYTLLEGFASGAPEAGDAGVDELKVLFDGGTKALSSITDAKIGDKTMMDALIPAVEAISNYHGEDVCEELKAAMDAAVAGAAKSADFISKYGRAKSYKEKTIGTPDAGAVSTQYFFIGLYEGLVG